MSQALNSKCPSDFLREHFQMLIIAPSCVGDPGILGVQKHMNEVTSEFGMFRESKRHADVCVRKKTHQRRHNTVIIVSLKQPLSNGVKTPFFYVLVLL